MDESPYTKTHGSPSPQYRIGGCHGVNTLFSWISRSLARITQSNSLRTALIKVTLRAIHCEHLCYMSPCTKPNSYIVRFPDQIYDQYSLHYFRTFKIPCLIDPSSEVAGKNTENPSFYKVFHACCMHCKPPISYATSYI